MANKLDLATCIECGRQDKPWDMRSVAMDDDKGDPTRAYMCAADHEDTIDGWGPVTVIYDPLQYTQRQRYHAYRDAIRQWENTSGITYYKMISAIQ